MVSFALAVACLLPIKIKKGFPRKRETSEMLPKQHLQLFVLFCSVCVFETVFFVETVHTSVCLCEFLTSSVEWM
ncbi:hypothetical protein DW084_12495 [Enterococcus casseliflavus]|uniref:Uncharacterized protein n=1 Tax=Enterococcus casseliflavus TaxID=37734 RepID=A0A415EQH4_ENTCA|nr:hypothetical protein DW084_12495 [Enterococcus casseliflavus]